MLPLLLLLSALPGDVIASINGVERQADKVLAAAASVDVLLAKSEAAGQPVALEPLRTEVMRLQTEAERLKQRIAALEAAWSRQAEP